MTTESKLNWLVNDFIKLLETLSAEQKGNWGVMKAQQMVEHMSYSVRHANGRDIKTLLTPPENLERIRAFALSDREFRENTKNIELPETALPLSNPSMTAAIEELKTELKEFKNYFQQNKDATLMNPFFGELNFEQWVHLLHKHAMHHARQFNLID